MSLQEQFAIFRDGKGNFISKQCPQHGGHALTVGYFNNDGDLGVVSSVVGLY